VDIVQQAKTEILAEYFSVWNDDQSVGGFALLLDAAKRGIKVKVIIDALSNKVPRAVFSAMVENGKDAQGHQNIEIKLYNPPGINLLKLSHRDHSKMLIIDGKRMITGGRNIGDKYFGLNSQRNFEDLDILLEGRAVKDARENFLAVFDSDLVKDATRTADLPTQLYQQDCTRSTIKDTETCQRHVKSLLKRYVESTNRIQKTLEDILKQSPGDIVTPNTDKDWLADVDDGADLEFMSQKPQKLVSKDTNDLSDALLAAAGTAKKDLNILSPYLIPTKSSYVLLKSLLKKNVRVRIITNSLRSTDNLFAQAGYLHAKDKLIAMGVELYEFKGPDTAHAKAAVIDNSLCFVGTFNLDPRSSFINREVGIFVKSSPNNEIANSLTAVIEHFRENTLLVGKNGVPQNVEEQEKTIKELSHTKRFVLRIVRMLLPLFANQI
jgi:putative cardiolipin synthase